MLSRDSVHLSELQRDPNKYVKYKFKKKTVFLSPEIVKWNSFMFFLLMMMNSASASLQVLWMWAACISLHTFQRTLRVSACRGQRTWRKVTTLESNAMLAGTLVGTQYRNTVRKIGNYDTEIACQKSTKYRYRFYFGHAYFKLYPSRVFVYSKHLCTSNQPQPLRGNVRRPQIDRYNDRKRYPTNFIIDCLSEIV